MSQLPAIARPDFCLGGRDLEMLAIRELLKRHPEFRVHDRGLSWGAKASAYLEDIRQALSSDRTPVLVELEIDLPDDIPRDRLHIVDHHGPLAGIDRPTSIEQIFKLLGLPHEAWTRDLALIAANDRGHTTGMMRIGATLAEMLDIRRRDRAAQGITESEEEQGREAAANSEQHFGGKLTVVQLPHGRTATVTDRLDELLGGPGYQNLLILGLQQTTFFGSGRYIDALRTAFSDGWFGGELPRRGYWGCGRVIQLTSFIDVFREATK